MIEKLKNRGLAVKCINALSGITEQSLKKTTGHYGYDEPRVLEKACYLGILALKKGWEEVFAEVWLKIYEFEPKYFTKYFKEIPADINPANHRVLGLPHSDQLFRELLRWRDDYERESRNGTLRIQDDAEAMMYEIIERKDIDWFMFEVWGKFPADSEIDKEIELKFARKRLVIILKRVITKRSTK